MSISLTTHNKIASLKNLARFVEEHRSQGQKIVHCHGVFDLLHIGHIRYFDQARRMGDILIVTITPDRFVDKGPYRPAFNEKLRAEAVASLDSVDLVAINNWSTATETLRLLRPDFYVKGSDFKDSNDDPTGKLALEEDVVREIGAEMAFTKDIVFSSTNLINRFLSSYPADVKQYINLFKTRYALDGVLELLDRFSTLNVLVIGDTIIDDYQYCNTLGVSSKDPALALQYKASDVFAGGVLAIANHLANFTNRVKMITVLGDTDSYEGFIRSKLQTNVSPQFITKKNSPTTVKKRFVEGYSMNKLFEVYTMDDSGLSAEQESRLCEILRAECKQYDLVIAADFGHGAIGDMTRKVLVEEAKFLTVNTQANAGNRGFHTINCYPKGDYISLACGEIHLEFRNMNGEEKPMALALAQRMDSKCVAVTMGKKGCLLVNKNGESVEVPALVQKVVDRVGSGDAFFSITSLAACLEADAEMIGFLGNVVGGLAVEVLGNKTSIDRQSVVKFVTSLLK